MNHKSRPADLCKVNSCFTFNSSPNPVWSYGKFEVQCPSMLQYKKPPLPFCLVMCLSEKIFQYCKTLYFHTPLIYANVTIKNAAEFNGTQNFQWGNMDTMLKTKKFRQLVLLAVPPKTWHIQFTWLRKLALCEKGRVHRHTKWCSAGKPMHPSDDKWQVMHECHEYHVEH